MIDFGSHALPLRAVAAIRKGVADQTVVVSTSGEEYLVDMAYGDAVKEYEKAEEAEAIKAAARAS